jgi:hypothetical protein
MALEDQIAALLGRISEAANLENLRQSRERAMRRATAISELSTGTLESMEPRVAVANALPLLFSLQTCSALVEQQLGLTSEPDARRHQAFLEARDELALLLLLADASLHGHARQHRYRAELRVQSVDIYAAGELEVISRLLEAGATERVLTPTVAGLTEAVRIALLAGNEDPVGFVESAARWAGAALALCVVAACVQVARTCPEP